MALSTQSSEPTVHAFLSHFKNGGARPNRFKVFITFPGNSDNSVPELVSFTCKASKIPAGTIGIAEANYMGRIIKIAGDREIDNWTVSVYNDIEFKTRDAFIKWQEKMLGMSTNLASSGWEKPPTYFGSAEVVQFDREDRVLKTYTVDGLFPISVGEITLDWGENNSLEMFDVEFAMNEWRDESITQTNNGTSLTNF